MAFFAVDADVHPKVLAARPIHLNLVEKGKGTDKVVHASLVRPYNRKVIYDEREMDRTALIAEHRRRAENLRVTMLF